MAGKKKKKDPKQTPNQRTISQNRKARHRFKVLETLECGVQLVGSEVKSLRDGKISLEEAYGRVGDGEVWLVGCDIPEYTQASQWNHEPRRPRKLLLHRSEIRKFANQAHEKGLTLVPLKIYFNDRGMAKMELGIAVGKRAYDKRQTEKSRDWARQKARLMRDKG